MFTGQDIRDKRKKLGLSAEELAEILGVSKDNIYKWEKGHKPGSGDNYLKVENWLSGKTENVPRVTPYVDRRRDLKNGEGGSIPVFTGNTRAGTIEVYSDDPAVNEPVGHLPANIFPGCNHAEKVSGDSMHPVLINQGFAIGKVIDKKGIIYGEKYIIHTQYGLSMVKYLQAGEKKGYIKLVSYNKNIPAQEIPYDDITFCCRIYFIVNPS